MISKRLKKSLKLLICEGSGHILATKQLVPLEGSGKYLAT